MSNKRGNPKTRTGVVVSDRMDKTVSVRVERAFAHPVYGKTVRRSSKLLAHDETNDCRVGDRVMLTETRPLSSRKRWRVSAVIERAR
ncbi:30S ribosomal protein S17 [Candidatus Poribacteria bacterium]|nr:30S ribosomal protein S17 [Candidatus Poribacteria bacterium]